MAKHEAGLRHAEHAWTEAIGIWASGVDWAKRGNFVTAREIYLEALQGTDKTLDRKATVPIAMVMKAMGWTKTFKLISGRSVRGYMKGMGAVTPKETEELMGDL